MIRATRLAATPLVTIDRVDHPAGVRHIDPEAETSQTYSINLLERGAFFVRHRARQFTIGLNEIFVTVPGEVYGYTHDEHDDAPTDVCLAICFSDRAQEEITGSAVRALARRVPFVPLNNRRAYLRQRLRACLDGAPALTIESITGELLFGALEDTGGRLYRPSQLEWYARRIDAARRLLDEDYASEYTLSRLAAVSGMSPYHFARVFHDLVGTPPHRYLVHRRLAAAAAMLMSGASVTESCYAAGFQSLSHFITRFRHRFGVSPSGFVRAGRARPAISDETDPKSS